MRVVTSNGYRIHLVDEAACEGSAPCWCQPKYLDGGRVIVHNDVLLTRCADLKMSLYSDRLAQRQ